MNTCISDSNFQVIANTLHKAHAVLKEYIMTTAGELRDTTTWEDEDCYIERLRDAAELHVDVKKALNALHAAGRPQILNKIPLIKLIRERTDMGLKDSKDLIEAIEAKAEIG